MTELNKQASELGLDQDSLDLLQEAAARQQADEDEQQSTDRADNELDAGEPQATAPAPKKKSKVWVLVVALLAAIILALGLAFMAVMILDDSDQGFDSIPQETPMGQPMGGFPAQESTGAAVGFSDLQMDGQGSASPFGGSSQQQNDAVDDLFGSTAPPQAAIEQLEQQLTAPQSVQQPVFDDALAVNTEPVVVNQDALIIPYSVEEETQHSAPEQKVSLTEEEMMYDALLESVDGLDVPIEAIKIDRSVIESRDREKRVSSVEQSIKQTQSEVKALGETIDSIKDETIALVEAIKENNEFTKKISADLDGIRSQMADRLDSLDKKMAQMEKDAKARPAVAAVTAPAKPAARPAPAKPAPKPAPKPVAKPAPKPAVAAAPKPAAKPAPAAPRTMAEVVSSACSKSSKVSQVWRVAGANTSSAYLVRAADGVGLMVKPGSEVPGFGTVRSVDLNARTVCTTSGLVGR